MSELLKYAKENNKKILQPFGEIDVLLLYGIVGERLKKYLQNRELASKVWIPSEKKPYLIKRGSKLEPLYIEELVEAITPQLLEIRREEKNLRDAKKKITKTQEKVWKYFLPRKLSEFYYATNCEGIDEDLDRIFFDLDRGKNISAKQAQEAVNAFIEAIEEDEDLESRIGEYELFPYWTGRSFHVILFPEKTQPPQTYTEHFQYSKHEPKTSFTGRWAEKVNSQTSFKVKGGHEKEKNTLNIDPSQTPSGKLCRAPLGSLHMKGPETVDGVSIPLSKDTLGKKGLTRELEKARPENILSDLTKLSRRLPKKFR